MNRPHKDELRPDSPAPQPVYGGNSQNQSTSVKITPSKE